MDPNSSSQEKIKIVAVGDGAAGKTCILLSYTNNKFPDEYVPTIFDNYSTLIKVGDKAVTLDLWDTAGQDEYEKIRQLAYLNADVFLIVLDVTQPSTYQNAMYKWYKDIQASNPDAQKIFVGNKIDIRDEIAKKYKETDKQYPIYFPKAQKDISKLGCKFVECSAKTQEGLKNVFDQAIAIGLKAKNKSSKPSSSQNGTSSSKDNEKKPKKKKICTIF